MPSCSKQYTFCRPLKERATYRPTFSEKHVAFDITRGSTRNSLGARTLLHIAEISSTGTRTAPLAGNHDLFLKHIRETIIRRALRSHEMTSRPCGYEGPYRTPLRQIDWYCTREWTRHPSIYQTNVHCIALSFMVVSFRSRCGLSFVVTLPDYVYNAAPALWIVESPVLQVFLAL